MGGKKGKGVGKKKWDFNEAREIQERILAAYEQDFSKHAPIEVAPRIRMLWNSIPLKACEDLKAFKLFLADVGLLGCMVRLNQSVLLDGNELFKEFNGALADQYVLQRIKTETNLKAKSLKTFCGKYNPKMAIRTSMTDYKKEDWLLNLPLWAVEKKLGSF